MEPFLSLKEYSDQSRVASLLSSFEREFDGKKPEAIIRVPGRVNLIGEHIDYCGYAVHPMAIEQDILVAVARSKGILAYVKLIKNIFNGDHPLHFINLPSPHCFLFLPLYTS